MGVRKWTWLPAFILAAAVVTPALSGTPEPLEVKTKITEVTVYPRRAQIKRVGQLTVPAGVHRIQLTGLPYRLLTQSVRVKLMGLAGLSFMGVEVQSKYHRQVTSPQEKALRQKLEGMLGKYRRINDQINIINGQLQFLRSLSKVTARRVGDQVLIKLPATKDIDALMSFAAKKSLVLLDQRRALHQKRSDLAKDMRVVRSELGKIRRGFARWTKTAVVLVKAQQAGQVKVELQYLVGGATWRPLYVARGLAGEAKVRLTMLAQIRQRTDEDWRGVKVTLSTAQPSVSARAPYLGVWRLSLYTPEPMPKLKRAYRRRTGAARTKAMPPPPPSPATAARSSEDASRRRARTITAGISSGLGSYRFKINFPMDVPADGRYHQTTILVKDLPAKIERLAVPARSTRVFIQAKVVNDTQAVLLPGRVNIFHGADYVGSARLGMISPKQEFALALGVDPEIRIKRQRLVFKKGNVNKWAKRLQLAWRTEITNHHQGPITVRVRDRMPVSGSPDLKLVRLKVTPRPTEQDKDRGMFTWVLKLKPGQKAILHLGLTYRYPAKRNMTGI